MKRNNKNTLKGVLIGGLLLSAPFATFAVSNVDFENTNGNRMGQGKGFSHSQGSLIDAPYVDENYIERLDAQIEQKVENAKFLIEQLAETDSSVDVGRLNAIVDEFAELDAELDALDIEDAQADELREIFFETRDEATDLTTEFREIITEAFSDDEIVELRAELQQRSGLGNGDGYGNQMGMRAPLFSTEVITLIDADIAQQLEDDEITLQEAHDLIKEKMDAMSEDELLELRDLIRSAMPDEDFQRGMGKGGHGKGSGMNGEGQGFGQGSRR